MHGAVDFAVGYPGKVELAGDDPEPGDADHDRIGDKAPVVPQPADGVGHRGNVFDFTVDDGAGGEPDLTECHQFGRAGSELELGGTNCTGAYVESYDLLHGNLPPRRVRRSIPS